MSKQALLRGIGAGLSGAGQGLAQIEQQKQEQANEERRLSVTEKHQRLQEMMAEANEKLQTGRLNKEIAGQTFHQRHLENLLELDFDKLDLEERKLIQQTFEADLGRMHDINKTIFGAGMEVYMMGQQQVFAAKQQGLKFEHEEDMAKTDRGYREELLQLEMMNAVIGRARAGALDLINEEGMVLMQFYNRVPPDPNTATDEELEKYSREFGFAVAAAKKLNDRANAIAQTPAKEPIPAREIQPATKVAVPVDPSPAHVKELAGMSSSARERFLTGQVKAGEITMADKLHIQKFISGEINKKALEATGGIRRPNQVGGGMGDL